MTALELLRNDLSTPLMGVPLTVLATAAGGAFASFAYGGTEKSRARLFFLALANTYLGAVGVAVIPSFLGWQWVTPVMQPPLAGLLAFFARWSIPLFIEQAPQWIRDRISSLSQPK